MVAGLINWDYDGKHGIAKTFGTILENPNSGNDFSTDLPTRLACITLFIQQSLPSTALTSDLSATSDDV